MKVIFSADKIKEPDLSKQAVMIKQRGPVSCSFIIIPVMMSSSGEEKQIVRRGRGRRPRKALEEFAWSDEDDDKLRYLLCIDKMTDWNEISNKIPNKTAKECEERFAVNSYRDKLC
jgi:hypothetical protein